MLEALVTVSKRNEPINMNTIVKQSAVDVSSKLNTDKIVETLGTQVYKLKDFIQNNLGPSIAWN